MVQVEYFDDLLRLGDFNLESCLENVKGRFQDPNEEKVFTQIGAPILISVNPYKVLPLFKVKQANLVR